MTADLRSHLRASYSRAAWSTVLADLFPSGSLHLLQHPEHIAAPCEFVTRTQQLGSVQLPDGNQIALLEVEVEDQVQLARNRVALRNFVAKFIDEAATQAVLAVFHQPGKTDWRLTYASKRSQLDEDTLEITSIQTAPRRYTFLLGESEPCRTAAGRLAEIRERGEHLTLEDVEKAFSVERLNKEFFKLYKEHYDRFVAHLLAPERVKAVRTAFGVPFIRDDGEASTAAAQDKADKPIRDFVKRLLGRLVFLHFLQKKGWMGCKAGGKAWTGGDTDFLHTYYQLAKSKGEAEHFHSRWLLPLFFEALNQDHDERPGHLFAPTGTRIPYLNGGLFEASEVEQTLLSASLTGARALLPASSKGQTGVPASLVDFPASHFEALLDFFGQYHFTIDENDPEDHEVGIDPEMLGHIFENLLEDNKDKGAYYTPKAIVSYMARQSLLHYLQTHLGEHAELASLLNEKDLTRLEKNGFVHTHAKRIAELLDAVKVCDPAIGSGAFPIGVLQEILWTRLALDWTLNTPEDRARLKRQIIQNSIHGVDLDPGAVEIARLRFWLALVVDEDQPRPLPNLDYKIHRADSLIEYIRGEPVHLGKVSAEDKRTHGAILSLITAKQSLFTAQRLPEKRAARFALYRALAEVALAEFNYLKVNQGLALDDDEKSFDRIRQLDIALKEFTHRLKLIDSATKESAKIQDRILADLRAWFDDEKEPTFLWQLHFGEVFAQGGFDIVIGNPPYISVEKFARTEAQQVLKDRFTTYAARGDIYCFFYERGFEMLKPTGVISLITSNKFQRTGYGSKLRTLLIAHRLCTLIDFCELPVFEAATDPIIVVAKKECSSGSHSIQTLVVKHSSEIPGLLASLERRSQSILHDKLGVDGWNLETQDDKAALREKIQSCGHDLWEHSRKRVYCGIKTGFNDAFVISDTIRDQIVAEQPSAAQIIKPWLGGKDVDRWHHVSRNIYCIVFPFGFHEELKRFTPVLRHLSRFQMELKKRGQCLTSRSGQDGGQHHWLELDNNPTPDFLQEFENDHIVLPLIKKGHGFSIAKGGTYSNNKTAICVVEDPGFTLACLNSKLIEWLCRLTFPSLGDPWLGGRLEYHVGLVKRLPIPPASAADKARLSELAQACAAAAQRGDDETLAVHEAEIDQIVYRLFDLTDEEVALIESSLAPTRATKPAKRKAARSLPSAEPEDASEPLSAPPRAKSTSKPPHTECADHSPAATFLPDELFRLEGALAPAKKAPAAREAAKQADKKAGKSVRAPVQSKATKSDAAQRVPTIPIDQTERDDVLATIREVFATGGERDRDTALKEIATALGYERLGPHIREVLSKDIRTAVGRGILQNRGGQLSLSTRAIGDYDRAELKKLFLAAINQNGRLWHTRDDAIRLFTRWLGFRRTGSLIEETARSLINGLLREGSLEKNGPDKIRRI